MRQGITNGRWVKYSWLATLFLLVACLGGRGQANQPMLTCSESCAAQGQCGTTEDGRQVVLAHSESPQTQNHTLFLPIDTAVEIQSSANQTIQQADGQQYGQDFSYVVMAEPAKSGWVANWCIAFPPAPEPQQ